MIQFNDSIVIARSQDRVFSVVTDIENIPQWQAEVVQSKVITPGPVRMGTRFSETVKIGPWRVAAECAVTEFQKDRMMAFNADTSPVRYEGRFTLEPVPEGTRVSISGRAQLNGLWKLMQPLLAEDIRKGVKHELESLKTFTEK